MASETETDSEGTKPEESQATETEERPLVLLESTACPGTDTESLHTELGRSIVSIDPLTLDADAYATLAAAAAIVVQWDLGSQAGLDIVEELHRDERTSGVPIVMSSVAPTPRAVALAHNAGAVGFIFHPYRVDEIRRHVPSDSTDSIPTQNGSDETG